MNGARFYVGCAALLTFLKYFYIKVLIPFCQKGISTFVPEILRKKKKKVFAVDEDVTLEDNLFNVEHDEKWQVSQRSTTNSKRPPQTPAAELPPPITQHRPVTQRNYHATPSHHLIISPSHHHHHHPPQLYYTVGVAMAFVFFGIWCWAVLEDIVLYFPIHFLRRTEYEESTYFEAHNTYFLFVAFLLDVKEFYYVGE